MYMRAVTFRIVYVGVLSLGILAGMAFREATVHAAPMATPAAARASAATAVAPVVTLPTINVRHGVAARGTYPKSKGIGPVAAAVLDAMPDAAPAAVAGALPTLRLDMPYYSFGKLLPRVGKE